MTTRWKRFYAKQMEDPSLQALVERELEHLQLGVQIAKLRAEGKLSQTKLAARAEMSAPKISAMENGPQNLTIGTLIRVAHALDSRVEIKLVRRKRAKEEERANGVRNVRTRGNGPKGRAIGPAQACLVLRPTAISENRERDVDRLI